MKPHHTHFALMMSSALADSIAVAMTATAHDLKVEHATMRAAAHEDEEGQRRGAAPWNCMSDKFSILEPELRCNACSELSCIPSLEPESCCVLGGASKC